MQYKKLTYQNTIIEFHNNWLGEETVIVNGQEVSKKSSIWGTNHHFTIIEDGEQVAYVLTTRINQQMGVEVDLIRNGVVVEQSVPVGFGSKPGKPRNPDKKRGLEKLLEYSVDEAMEHFARALEVDSRDPEVHFYMACIYSLTERAEAGFSALRDAVEFGLADREQILTHDMLAFLRIQPEFEEFVNSGFVEFEFSKGEDTKPGEGKE